MLTRTQALIKPHEVVVSRFISDHFASGQLPIDEPFLTLTYIFSPILTYGRGIRTRTDAATSPSIAFDLTNSADKDYGHHSTLRIGVHKYLFLQFSMNYALSLGSGSDSRLFSHT